MKFMKRSNLYQASNVSFSPATIEARSYSWWVFVAVIEGKVIFNNFRYSNTTAKHQYKVRRLMEELGIEIDLVVETRYSLIQAEGSLEKLEEMVLETLSDQEFHQCVLRDRRNERARAKREMNRQREEKTPHLSLVGEL